MSIKHKLTTAKDKVVTYLKTDGKSILITGGVLAAAATVYVIEAHSRTLREYQRDIENLKRSDDSLATAINFIHQNPTLLTPIEGEDDRFSARYVKLDDTKPLIRYVEE